MAHTQNQHDASPPAPAFSEAQFAQLVELLTPISKLAEGILSQAEQDAPSDQPDIA